MQIIMWLRNEMTCSNLDMLNASNIIINNNIMISLTNLKYHLMELIGRNDSTYETINYLHLYDEIVI